VQTQGRQLISDSAAGGAADAEIDCMILLDRSIDLVSPFLIQQNYEGQIDETFGIQSGYTEIENSVIAPTAAQEEQRDPNAKLSLRLTNENDFIFKEIRNLSLSALGSVTSRKL